MEMLLYLFYLSTSLLLISTLSSIFINGKSGRKPGLTRPINTMQFKNRKSSFQFFTMITGLAAAVAFYATFFANTEVTMPLLIHEVYIITVTLAISSAFLSHHDNNKLNVVGVVHLSLCVLAVLCIVIFAAGAKAEENLRIMVDILAHSVTLASSIVALFGDTFHEGKLTETGQAVLVVVTIFFGISIFSSMDSQFQAKLEANDLQDRFEKLGGRMASIWDQSTLLAENMTQLNDVSAEIKENVDNYEHFITKKVSEPITRRLNNHFGDGNRKGLIYHKIDSVRDSEHRILRFVDAYDQDVKRFEAKASALESETQSLKRTLTDFETARIAYEAAKADYEERIKKLNDTYDAMVRELKEIEKQRNTQVAQLESKLTELNELVKVNSRVKEFLKQKTTTLDSAKVLELKKLAGL